LSHEKWAATASARESGSMEAVGKDERPISTTGVMATSPSFIMAPLSG